MQAKKVTVFLFLLLLPPAICWGRMTYLTVDVPFSSDGVELSNRSILKSGVSLGTFLSNLVPVGVEISSFSVFHGKVYFTLDHPADMGGQSFSPSEIISYDLGSGEYGLAYDLSTFLPAGVEVDALSFLGPDRFVFSVDVPVNMSGTAYSESDLIEYRNGTLSSYLSGAAMGIPPGANLDGVAVQGTRVFFSLDVPCMLGGVVAGEMDVVSKSGSVYHAAFQTDTLMIPEGVNLTGFQVDPDIASFLYLLLGE